MAYLTLEEYFELGGKYALASKLFNRLEYSSRMEINQATFNRLSSLAEQTEDVKRLMVELIDYNYEKSTTDGVVTSKSVSQGGISQSESYAVDTDTNVSEELIERYLSNLEVDGIPVLYRGCG